MNQSLYSDEQAFNTKLEDFRKDLVKDNSSSISLAICRVLFLMTLEVNCKKTLQEPIHFSMYIELIHVLTKIHSKPSLLKSPTYNELTMQIIQCKDHRISYSTRKLLLDSLTVAVGVALVSVSFACLVASGGGSTFGLTLGFSLMQTQLALGIGLIAGFLLSCEGTMGVAFRSGYKNLVSALEDIQNESLAP